VELHGTAAFVVGVSAAESSWRGSDTSGRLRLTLVAVASDDGWRIAGIHLGPLQAPPARG
jgi:hypothetical protein